MKTILPLICLTLASVGLTSLPASGQIMGNGVPPSVAAGGQPTVTPFQSAVATSWPGRYWFGVNLADNGFGYSGSYASLGVKTRLFDDYFDGRWLVEGRGHISLDRGGLFGNLGLERVFSVDAAGADIVFGAWYDIDDDKPGNFAHTLTQFSLNAGIRTDKMDIYANGFIPTGPKDYSLGDPTGQNVFLRNSIVVQPGIDSALEGWDANVRVRPELASMVNGSAELGVYYYKSDLIESFVGVRARAGMQLPAGMVLNADINHDDRFDWTGSINVGWIMGGSGPNAEYAGLGRDLERTSRPDHIARYQQDLVLAIDPDTGSPYVVWHVDNSVASSGDGSFENPFATLDEAEAASGADNVIFVRDGRGSFAGYNNGIALKTGQLLLGDGVNHLVPIQGGGLFSVFGDLDGARPTITNTGAAAVTLASRNTVRGFVIDGNGSAMSNGIQGNGSASGTIEDVQIFGAPALNGIALDGVSGAWRFARNDIRTALIDGIAVTNVTDPTARFTFDRNQVLNNVRDGIRFDTWNGSQVVMTNNDVSSNGRDGVNLNNYTGTNVDIDFNNHTGNSNARNGVALTTGIGSFNMENSRITGNVGSGIAITDFQDGPGSAMTVVANSVITGNGVGGGSGIDIRQSAGDQRVIIRNNTIDGNGIGINTIADGVGNALTVDVRNQISISNNTADAIRVASRGGSTTNFNLFNTNGVLTMANNGGAGGLGIAFFAEDGGGPTSVINADIRNIAMTGTGAGNAASGIFGSAQGDAQLLLDIADSSFTGGVGGSSLLFDFDANAGAVSRVSVVDSTINASGIDAVNFNIAAASQVDIILQGLTMNGGSRGVNINMSGTSMTRMSATDNNISGFTFDGMSLVTGDNSQFLATISGNTITGNGPGLDPTMDPYFDGINILSAGASRQSLRIDNNNISGNQEFGMDINTLGTSQIDVLLTGNTISNNDTGTNSPGVNDFQSVNGATGTLCLAMSTNFYALNANVVNNNAPANYTVELDGATNGPGVPNFIGGVGNFNVVPFGTTCLPNIQAQEAVFAGAGFP